MKKEKTMDKNTQKKLLARYERALKRIGTANLLSLPEPVKEVLRQTKDLAVKTTMLEKIADEGKY